MLASYREAQNIFINAKGMQKYARKHRSGGSLHYAYINIVHTYKRTKSA